MAVRSPEIDRPALRFGARVSDDLRRFLDSDLVHSFMRSPVTIAAAIVTLLLFLAALAAPWLAPHDTYNVASLNLMDAFRPPAWGPRPPRPWPRTPQVPDGCHVNPCHVNPHR